MAISCVTLTAQYIREPAVLHTVVFLHWYRLYTFTDKVQDGVATPLLIVEVAVPLVVLQVQRLRSLLFQVQQLLEQHLRLLVLLLAMMEDAARTSTMHCVIPMALMEAVARTHDINLTHRPR